MNNIFLLAVLAASTILMATGCNKDKLEPVPDTPEEVTGYCELGIALSHSSSVTTKAGEATDDYIQNIQIFVFRGDDNMLDACASKGFDNPLNYNPYNSGNANPYKDLKLRCTVGSRTVYAVVNADKDYTTSGDVVSESDLLNLNIDLLAQSKSKLFMIGSTGTVLTSGESEVAIDVTRACSRVKLESLTNDMEAKAYQKDGSFKFCGAYLVNVPAMMDFACERKAAQLEKGYWYAQMNEDESKASMLDCGYATETSIKYGSSLSVDGYMYSFPNECAPDDSETWTPRATMLVVEAKINEKTYYYPVTLYNESNSSGLERNTSYNVRLTIHRPGSDSPGKPVEFNTMTGSVTVVNWVNGTSYTEEI